MLKRFSKHYTEMGCKILLGSYDVLINKSCLVFHPQISPPSGSVHVIFLKIKYMKATCFQFDTYITSARVMAIRYFDYY
jgi:hypothetical protein